MGQVVRGPVTSGSDDDVTVMSTHGCRVSRGRDTGESEHYSDTEKHIMSK